MSTLGASERTDGGVEHINPNDRDGRSTSRPEGDEDGREEATDPGSVYPHGDGSVSEGRDEEYSVRLRR